jgi:REP element-mobilizing transposase RayT
MTFNLGAPPGFKGFDEQRPVTVYHRNLPHWRQDGATYFVTFCLADALPREKLRQLQAMREDWCRKRTPASGEADWLEYAKQTFRNAEKWMDRGYGRCSFRDPFNAAELSRAILHFHEARYEVGCFAILGNHCHLTMRPFQSVKLEKELGSIKSRTARFVNQQAEQSGPVWQQECYDRIIRDEEHLWRVVQYIGANPRKAGLKPDEWIRWMNPHWIAAGWNFRDPTP